MNKILIVDDEPDVQALIGQMLDGEGFETEQAGNGAEAVETYRRSPSDVVVMDLHMPEISGVEVIRLLRQIDVHVAVVVLTGYGDMRDAVELLRNDGVYDYLTKPLDSPEVLIAAVHGALEKRRLALENRKLIDQLKTANEDLETQVGARTRALMTSNRQLSLELRRRRRIEATLEEERAELERRVEHRTSKLSEINRRLNLEIAERRRSEVALRQSELSAHMQSLELEMFYRSAPVGLCLLDKDMKFIKANHTMTTITGLALEDHLGQGVATVSPRLAKALLPVSHRLLETGKPILSHVISLPDGLDKSILRHWLVSSYSLRIEGEGGVATSHIFQDISEQRHAQEFIRQSKTMLQAVFDGISDPLLMVDRRLVVRMLNRAAKSYYNIDAYGDVIGKVCSDIFPPHGRCDECQIPQLVAAGRPAMFERQGYMDGNKIEKVAVYPLSQSASGLDGAIIQVSDITETKTLERQLFHNEKLASLGMLVSGVAHEVNNPNGFITFNLPILRSYLEAMVNAVTIEEENLQGASWFGMPFHAFCQEVFKLIDNLEHGSQRISKIIASMKSLARPQSTVHSMQRCDLDRLLEQVETLCRLEFEQQGQQLTIDFPSDLPEVFIDPDALEQVLINLLMNAAQAGEKPDPWVRLTVERVDDARLAFTIRDNGAGMEKDVLGRIFDPFFTTKPSGVGTGLGLAVCHNLVEGMGGTIRVESTPGVGSTFRFSLPVKFTDETPEGCMDRPLPEPGPLKASQSA